jgi:hypothetical protein
MVRLFTVSILVVLLAPVTATAEQFPNPVPHISLFFRAGFSNHATADSALAQIAAEWKSGYAAMILEVAEVIERTQGPESTAFARYQSLMNFLQKQTGQSFGDNLDGWRHWIWSHPYNPHPEYGALKGQLYGIRTT